MFVYVMKYMPIIHFKTCSCPHMYLQIDIFYCAIGMSYSGINKAMRLADGNYWPLTCVFQLLDL